MLEHVAVLSDIHAVLPALEAVLDEPDVASAQRIVLTGDIASGPLPVETIDRLSGLGERVVWIGGNADREMVEYLHGLRPAISDPIAPWAAERLRADQVELLAGLPGSVRLSVDGLGEVLFCHATPRDDEEVVLVDSRPDRWAEVLDGVDPRVATVVCGHTHMPFVRLAQGRLVVNPGSVGMPYGPAGAYWALLGPGVQLRRTLFDTDRACARLVTESGYPGVDDWAEEYLRGVCSAEDAMEVFGPRDGRSSTREVTSYRSGSRSSCPGRR